MKKNYLISLGYTNTANRPAASEQTLHMSADNAGLTAFLHTLNASPDISWISVASTISFPALHVFGKLSHRDLGLEEKELNKLR